MEPKVRVAWMHLVAAVLAAGSTRAAEDLDAAPPTPLYDIAVKVHGNDTIATGDLERSLRGLIADLRERGVDRLAVEDSAHLVKRYYARRGFPEAQVDARWEKHGEVFVLRFQVEEGKRTFLERVEFHGAEHFSDDELADCLSWESTGLFGMGDVVFSEDVLAEGVSCTVARYRLEGFHFVEVTSSVETGSAGGVVVSVSVAEGPRVFVREPVVLDGVKALDESLVREHLRLDPPVPFAPRLPAILKGRLLDYYRERGYRFVEVRVEREVDRASATAHLKLIVEEGPLSRIQGVDVTGNEDTWDSVILRYVRLRPGDLYKDSEVRESYRGIIRSGLFDSVTIDVEPTDETREDLRLKINVREKPTYNLTALLGYGSWEQLRGAVGLENINLFGNGHSVRVEGRASSRSLRGAVSYLNPFFFWERLSHDALFYYEKREERSFSRREFGGETGLGLRLSDHLRTRAFYKLRATEVFDVSGDVPKELQQDVLLSTLNVAGMFDNRTSFINPQSGLTQRVAVEYSDRALGSELEFWRVTGNASWVVPLFGGIRLVPRGSTGAIFKFGETDIIPIQERFFLGGEDTIRSFRQDEAGPAVNGEPIGGEAFLLFSLELRVPVEPVALLRGLDAAIFADAGTVNEFVSDYGGGRWFFAVGFGVRYNTPVGPFRFDFAFNPDRLPEEDFFVFHFGLGYPF